MTRAVRDANEREKISTDGESRFSHSNIFRPIPRSERTVQLKLTRKIHGKRKSKRNREVLSKALAPGSNIIKVSPTTSTIKQPRKLVVTVGNSYTAKV